MASRQHNANKEALFAKSSPVAGKAGGAGAPTTFTTPALKPASKPTSTFTTSTNVGVRPDQPKRMDLNKLKEAEEYRSKASKALKTSMFGKWKPDYLNAAPYFERAAALYRAGGAEEQAKEMFLKAADCNEHLSTFAAAASNYKQAAVLAKDADEEEEAAKLFAKEADMWSIGGETGRAADALLKAAEAREDTSPGHAIDYCLQACDLLCPDENDPLDLKRAPLASDVFTKCLNLALRNERAKEALIIATKGAATVKAQNLTSSLYKLYATQTILQLYLGDVVAADKTFMEVHIQDSGYIRSPECEVGENLLQAAKENDATALEEAIKAVQKAYLDNNIIKMAKRLTLDRINGLVHDDVEEEEEEEEVASPSTSQRSVPLPQRRGPNVSPNDVHVNLDHVDKSLELSEEEKAKLRAKPAFGMAAVPAAAAPAPVQRRPQPASPPPKVGLPADQPSSGLMDLSDLQDGLDAAGDDDDFDLDAAIEAAKQQAGAVDEDDIPAPAPIPVSAPIPAPAPIPSLPTPTFTQPAPVMAAPAPPAKPTPPKPPKRVSEVPASISPSYDATHGPYSPGYDIAAPAPPATQAAPPTAAQDEEDDDDFLR